jgi:hypothetical protein
MLLMASQKEVIRKPYFQERLYISSTDERLYPMKIPKGTPICKKVNHRLFRRIPCKSIHTGKYITKNILKKPAPKRAMHN